MTSFQKLCQQGKSHIIFLILFSCTLERGLLAPYFIWYSFSFRFFFYLNLIQNRVEIHLIGVWKNFFMRQKRLEKEGRALIIGVRYVSFFFPYLNTHLIFSYDLNGYDSRREDLLWHRFMMEFSLYTSAQ